MLPCCAVRVCCDPGVTIWNALITIAVILLSYNALQNEIVDHMLELVSYSGVRNVVGVTIVGKDDW